MSVQTPQICRKVWLRVDQSAKAGKFIASELVRLVFLRAIRSFRQVRSVCPEIRMTRPILSRPYAVPPVVAVREASARPTDDRRLYQLQIVDQGLSNSTDVRNFRVLSNPDSIVDTAAQMLCEMPVDVRGYRSDRFVRQDFNPGRSGKGRTRRDKR